MPPPSSTSDLSVLILEHTPTAHVFSFTPFLSTAYSHKLAPAPRPTCRAFLQGHCPLGPSCPDSHVDPSQPQQSSSTQPGSYGHGGGSSFNSLVCKHWLRGLCKKGTTCEFLHEYNLRKMPECNFFVRNGYCSNGDECLYLHIDPMSKLPPCPHYERGFCPLGPNCAKKHVRRRLCPYYLAGFCPDGRACKEGVHPRWREDLPEPVAKSERREDDLLHGGAGGMGAMGDRHHHHGDDDGYGDRDGKYRDGDRDGDGGQGQRDRGFGRDHGRDRDRNREGGDHGSQRRWRGGRGGRGARGNRRFRH